MSITRFAIFCRSADGAIFEAFTWTRDEASGIRRAWADAERFGVAITDAWAVAK